MAKFDPSQTRDP